MQIQPIWQNNPGHLLSLHQPKATTGSNSEHRVNHPPSTLRQCHLILLLNNVVIKQPRGDENIQASFPFICHWFLAQFAQNWEAGRKRAYNAIQSSRHTAVPAKALEVTGASTPCPKGPTFQRRNERFLKMTAVSGRWMHSRAAHSVTSVGIPWATITTSSTPSELQYL